MLPVAFSSARESPSAQPRRSVSSTSRSGGVGLLVEVVEHGPRVALGEDVLLVELLEGHARHVLQTMDAGDSELQLLGPLRVGPNVDLPVDHLRAGEDVAVALLDPRGASRPRRRRPRRTAGTPRGRWSSEARERATALRAHLLVRRDEEVELALRPLEARGSPRHAARGEEFLLVGEHAHDRLVGDPWSGSRRAGTRRPGRGRLGARWRAGRPARGCRSSTRRGSPPSDAPTNPPGRQP